MLLLPQLFCVAIVYVVAAVGAVGVPLITPVKILKVNPAGKAGVMLNFGTVIFLIALLNKSATKIFPAKSVVTPLGELKPDAIVLTAPLAAIRFKILFPVSATNTSPVGSIAIP